MASEREDFSLSGPLHLTAVDWTNAHHTRSVAASLVQGVYIVERDRQQKRKGSQALAPPWWEFFHFKMLRLLEDDADFSIFGAIYEFKPPASHSNLSTNGVPRCVIAFRGTLFKLDTLIEDLKCNFNVIRHGLHLTPRFEIAIQAVRDMVADVGSSNVWLAGHSLGAAIALLAGKTMAKTGVFLESFLFNSPFPSAPIESIKDEKAKRRIRIAGSLITAGLAFAMKKNNHNNNQSADPFFAISEWVPSLYVNAADWICAEYIGCFERREPLEVIGLRVIERLAAQHSLGSLFFNAMGKESEPVHRIPSANLTVNSTTPRRHFLQAHGIHQWWRPDLRLESTCYQYK